MARSRAQLTLVPAPDLTHDDRTSADGCVTGSLFGDAAADAPAPADLRSPAGRRVWTGPAHDHMNVDAMRDALLARPQTADRMALLDACTVAQLRAVAAKLGHPGYARATDIPFTRDGAFTAALTATTMSPLLGRDGVRGVR